jgi:signal transduction histidine kinase
MEIVLSKRIKIVILILLYVAFFWIAGSQLSETTDQKKRDRIYRRLDREVKSVETHLKDKIDKNLKRGDLLARRFGDGTLVHEEMRPGEALVEERENKVGEYFGEIYHVRFYRMEVGKWRFIENNDHLYFLQKCSQNLFYVKHLFPVEQNFILERLNFPRSFGELEYLDIPYSSQMRRFSYDSARDLYYYDHILEGTNHQLFLHIRLFPEGIEQYLTRQRHVVTFGIVIMALFFLGIMFIARKNVLERLVAKIAFSAIFGILFYLSQAYGEKNIFLDVLGMRLNSIHEVLILAAFINYLLFILVRRLSRLWPGIVFFNVVVFTSVLSIDRILSSVHFYYSSFNFNLNYFSLLSVLFLLHLAPTWFVFGYKGKLDTSSTFRLLGFQALVVVLYYYWLPDYVFAAAYFSVILLLSVIPERRFLFRILFLFFAALSIYSFVSHNSIQSKQAFISRNLKNIFLNQGNYAKLIAREIVHEINSASKDFKEFFNGYPAKKLERIWRNSLAARENAGSGIFVLNKDKEILTSFSDQIPYIDVKHRDFFPVWAIEETEASLFGKEITLAVASTSVFDGSKLLGYIIVQVLNSPELILKERESINIFTINRRIEQLGLNYIKLSRDNRILENPSNINLQDIKGLLRERDRWIQFRFMDLNFTGYSFRDASNSIIIFYPEKSWVTQLAETIKIFLFLMVFYFIFSFRELRRTQWRLLLVSFSIKVFAILILLSLLTAVVFSVFSLDLNVKSSQRHLRQLALERGAAAQNIVNDLLMEDRPFDQNQLFFLSRMIERDITVYFHGQFLYTINYKKIIESRVPEYLSSNVRHSLEEKNQKFFIESGGDAFQLHFKSGDYIFNIDFAFTLEDLIGGRGDYEDYIITLFFILFVCGFSAAFFFRNKIMSPIDTLNKKMAEVKTGRLTALEAIPSDEELQSLYLGFNSMVEGIREQRKNISEISRMKTLVNMGRRVAHEVKNPLTPIKLSAEQILRSLRDKRDKYEETIEKSVKFIIDETDHLRKVSYGFLDLSRLDKIESVSFDIVELLQEEVFHLRQIYPRIEFELETGPKRLPVTMDQVKIKQVVTNVILNSIDAIGEREGRIRIEAYLRSLDGDNRVILKFADNGIGMDDDEVRRMFDEDYSTKETGSGIGMFVIKRIVDLHKGVVEIQSEKGEGTVFTIELPQHVQKTK